MSIDHKTITVAPKFTSFHPKYKLIDDDSPESEVLLDGPWLPRLNFVAVKVLCRDPLKISREKVVFKAFQHWAKYVLLLEKCEELGKQLQERLHVVQTVKESYLRDVVSVKMELLAPDKYKMSKILAENKINKTRVVSIYDDESSSGASSSTDLVDFALHSLSDNASEHLNGSVVSSTLRESIQDKIQNPWEHSNYYRKLKIFDSRKVVFLPSGGGCLHLYAPSKFALYVKYCKDCVGVMTLIQDWNHSIEHAFRLTFEYKNFEANRIRLESELKDLNDTVRKQRQHIKELTDRKNVLEGGSAWFETWSGGKQTSDEEEKLKSYVNSWKRIAEMAVSDRESAIYNVKSKYLSVSIALQQQVEDLQEELREECEQRKSVEKLYANEQVASKRLQETIARLENENRSLIKAVEDQHTEISRLDRCRMSDFETISELKRELAETGATSQDLIGKLSNKMADITFENQTLRLQDEVLSNRVKDYELSDLTQKTRIRGLEDSLATVSDHLDLMVTQRNSFLTNHSIIEDLMLKLDFSRKLIPVELEKLVSHVFAANSTYKTHLETIQSPLMTKKKKWTLRAVGFAVRYIARWFRASPTRTYKGLGLVGFQVLHLLQRDKAIKQHERIAALNIKVQKLEPLVDLLQTEQEVLRSGKVVSDAKIKGLTAEVTDLVDKVRTLKKIISGEISRDDAVAMHALYTIDRKTLAQFHRTVANEVCKILNFVRRKVSVLTNVRSKLTKPPTLQDMIDGLADVSIDSVMQMEELHRKAKTKYLLDKFKSTSLDLCLYMKKHTHEHAFVPCKLGHLESKV